PTHFRRAVMPDILRDPFVMFLVRPCVIFRSTTLNERDYERGHYRLPMAARRLLENALPDALTIRALFGDETMTVTSATVTIAAKMFRIRSKFMPFSSLHPRG